MRASETAVRSPPSVAIVLARLWKAVTAAAWWCLLLVCAARAEGGSESRGRAIASYGRLAEFVRLRTKYREEYVKYFAQPGRLLALALLGQLLTPPPPRRQGLALCRVTAVALLDQFRNENR